MSKKHKGRFPVPPAGQHQVGQRTTFAAEFRSAPLPTPEEFALYEQVLPGSANRLIRQVELQSEHRRTLEANVTNANIANEARGMKIGAVLAGMFIVGGFIAVITNHEIAGYAAIGWAAAQISGTYIVALMGKRKQLQPPPVPPDR